MELWLKVASFATKVSASHTTGRVATKSQQPSIIPGTGMHLPTFDMTPSPSSLFPFLPFTVHPLSSSPPSSLQSDLLHTNAMILSTSGGDSESTSSLCSCYAPITLHNGESSKGREGKRATARVNGHGADPVDQQLPPPPPLPSPLKSNLKKPIREEEQRQQQVMVRDGRRKVSWPDAHGRDLAHVQVFHSSASEEGEFAVAGKSCICNIQ